MDTVQMTRPAENLVIQIDFDDIDEDEKPLREKLTARAFTGIRQRIKQRQKTIKLEPGGYYHGAFMISADFIEYNVLFKVSRKPDGAYHLHVLIAPPASDLLFDWLAEF